MQRSVMLNQRLEVRMPDAPNVNPGNIASFALPIGRRYHELQLEITGTAVTLAHLERIRVMANEKPIHTYTAAERDSMNQFDGRAAWHLTNNPFLVIPFERYALENSVVIQETAIDTGPIASGNSGRKIRAFSLEIDLADGAPADIGLKLTATQSDSLGGGAGTILHVVKSIRDAAGAGDYDFADLPKGGITSQSLNRVFIKPDANDISKIKIERDTRTIFERSKSLNESVQKDGIRVPQSGYFVIDRTERGFAGNAISLVGVQDYRYQCTMTGAATVTFLSEYLGKLGD